MPDPATTAPAAARRRRRMREHAAPPRLGKNADPGADLRVLSGLAALSLDALSSVAYGPQSLMLVLVAAGADALRFTLPLTLVIAGMLGLLIVSYTQVIDAHPDGGGAYAVSKASLGRWPALLAGAALVVDYITTVAVSLAAGAASLASAFPGLSHHLLLLALGGLVVLTVINLFGISESAKLLMGPTVVFILGVFAVIVFGFLHPHPVAVIGTRETFPVTEALGVLLVLKAFAAGCSAVTGVEAIANDVPAFSAPKVRHAQRTEISLGVLLALMLVGLALLIHVHHVQPRGGVTVLAQLTAAALGHGWAFYVCNLSVALVLLFAANTSFGGLPVLLSLLARDNRLPHAFGLRAAKPVFRVGIIALAVVAGILLVAVGAQTDELIPLFTIGVFTGFTLSQTGLVRHWLRERSAHWRVRVILNGTGAVVTLIAVVVFVLTKFLEGAWVVVVAIPIIMIAFERTENYYAGVGRELAAGHMPAPPTRRQSIIVVPIANVTRLTEQAITAAMSLGEVVVAVAVAGDDDECAQITADWRRWPGAPQIHVIVDPRRAVVRSIVGYVHEHERHGRLVTVLIPELIPRKRRHEILHNQRGRLLATALKARTDVIVATLPFRLHD